MATGVDTLQDLIKARQHQRLLRLSFPDNDGPTCQFVVERLDGYEAMSRDFAWTVTILSDRANLALKDIQGKLISIALVRKDGTLRYFTGYCFAFRLVKAENIAHYEATLGPWVKYTSLRQDCYLFHHASVRDQASSILGEYGVMAQWRWDVRRDDPPMQDACQFNESDSNYLHRRWEAAGIYYHYEHDEKGHTLMLADDTDRARAIADDPEIVLQKYAGAEEADAISDWSPVRAMAPGMVAVSAHNFKQDGTGLQSIPTLNRQGNVRQIEHYEYTGAYGFCDQVAGDQMTRLRMEEMEAQAKQFEAAGNNTYVMPGCWFRLTDRFGEYPFERIIGPRNVVPAAPIRRTSEEFLIVTVRHLATNNYLQKDRASEYTNTLTCIRRDIPWRPGRGLNSVDTRINAPQTARVVGPQAPGSIHTDDHGRIRVQFHWDRIGKNDASSSAWIRVATNWAGAEFGATSVPRVGSEVIVQWLNGNPDRPIVTGCVHNGLHRPSWTLPTQSALSGWRSRELAPGSRRSNHLVLDDTSERIQAQLKSDHAHSQLSLGHITRIDSNAGRLDARGEGWELATDAWGVARAARGMLITTEARAGAAGTIKDMGETVQRLHQAAEQQQTLTKAAQKAGAQDVQGQQGEVAHVIGAQAAAIAGHGGDFPELAEAQLVLASPAGIAATASGPIHLASGGHTAITAGRNVALAVGDSLFASIGQTLRLFVHKAGMKLIAAAGKVTIQAHSDNIEVIANKVLTLISEADWVDVRGKKGVRLHGVNNMLEIGDKVQFFTSAPVEFHGNLETLAPKNTPQPEPPPAAPPSTEQLHYTLQAHAAVGGVHASVPYTLFKGDAKVEEGLTDDFGRIAIEHVAGTTAYKVLLANGEEFALKVHQRLAAESDASHAEHTASNQARRALDDTPDGREHT